MEFQSPFHKPLIITRKFHTPYFTNLNGIIYMFLVSEELKMEQSNNYRYIITPTITYMTTSTGRVTR